MVSSTRPIASSEIAAHVRAQGPQVGEERRGVEQWRQEDDEDQVGLELDVGHSGQQAERQATEHQQDRIRHREPAREHVQPGDGDEEDREEDLEVLHAGIIFGR